MARQWLRLYREILNKPKVQRLKPDVFKAWVNMLCTTEDDGTLPPFPDLAFALRLPEEKIGDLIRTLISAGLLDIDETGNVTAHDWSEHQYDSDVSNARVKRHRQRKRTVTCNVTSGVTGTPPEAETEQSRAEAERARECAPHPQPATPKPFVSKRELWPDGGVVPEPWLRLAEGERRRLGHPPVDVELVAAKFVNFHGSAQNQPRTQTEWQGKWLNFVLDEKAGKSNGSGQHGRANVGGTLDAIAREIAELEAIQRG